MGGRRGLSKLRLFKIKVKSVIVFKRMFGGNNYNALHGGRPTIMSEYAAFVRLALSRQFFISE
jgi:hypothetical protein